MPWVKSEEWIQRKFDELEKKGVCEITVILERTDLRDLGIKPSVNFGCDAKKATTFAKEMTTKGYKVLLASPTETGFLAWEVKSTGFHEIRRGGPTV